MVSEISCTPKIYIYTRISSFNTVFIAQKVIRCTFVLIVRRRTKLECGQRLLTAWQVELQTGCDPANVMLLSLQVQESCSYCLEPCRLQGSKHNILPSASNLPLVPLIRRAAVLQFCSLCCYTESYLLHTS